MFDVQYWIMEIRHGKKMLLTKGATTPLTNSI